MTPSAGAVHRNGRAVDVEMHNHLWGIAL